MDRDTPRTLDVGRPAPDRNRVSPWLLLYALVGAPLAWSAQLSANAAITGLVCLGPAAMRTPGGESTGALVSVGLVDLAAVAIGLGALAATGVILRRTHDDRDMGGVMNAGRGRTRYLGVWGLWTGILFLLAIAVSTGISLAGGLCPS